MKNKTVNNKPIHKLRHGTSQTCFSVIIGNLHSRKLTRIFKIRVNFIALGAGESKGFLGDFFILSSMKVTQCREPINQFFTEFKDLFPLPNSICSKFQKFLIFWPFLIYCLAKIAVFSENRPKQAKK